MRLYLFLLINLSLLSLSVQSQIDGTYSKFKVGVKFIADRAAWLGLRANYFPVYNGGIQFISNIQRSALSLETGLYQSTRIAEVNSDKMRYRYLMLPINLRWDGRNLYFAAGAFVDYLILINSGQSAYNPLDPDRKTGTGFNSAIGYEKSLTDDWNLFIELRYFRSLYPKHLYFSSYGIGFGVNYNFPK